MEQDESLTQYIERLSALPPRKRLDAYRAIQDPALRLKVARDMPLKDYGEILTESLSENLNRNVRERMNANNPKAA